MSLKGRFPRLSVIIPIFKAALRFPPLEQV
jgi:hypothetical protein